MSRIPTPEEAYEILREYNKEPFHLEHARTVSKVMGILAGRYDPERVDFWRSVGMLHDIDFELYPQEHCVKAVEMLRALDMDEGLIHGVACHGWGICSEVEPGAVHGKGALCGGRAYRTDWRGGADAPHGLEGMEVKSLSKKFKDKKFAAGLQP